MNRPLLADLFDRKSELVWDVVRLDVVVEFVRAAYLLGGVERYLLFRNLPQERFAVFPNGSLGRWCGSQRWAHWGLAEFWG